MDEIGLPSVRVLGGVGMLVDLVGVLAIWGGLPVVLVQVHL